MDMNLGIRAVRSHPAEIELALMLTPSWAIMKAIEMNATPALCDIGTTLSDMGGKEEEGRDVR
jgi:hypothetical protein